MGEEEEAAMPDAVARSDKIRTETCPLAVVSAGSLAPLTRAVSWIGEGKILIGVGSRKNRRKRVKTTPWRSLLKGRKRGSHQRGSRIKRKYFK